MAVICPHCKSPDMQAQLNTFQCLSCGRSITMEQANEQYQQSIQTPPDTGK